MAATDKPFRDQRALDAVFAISSILMLLSVVWMLYQDYDREYKHEQRAFREVEVALAQRQALEQIPTEEEFNAAEAKVEASRQFRDEKKSDLASARVRLINLRPEKERAEASYQETKAAVESITSFRSIALEHNDTEAAQKHDERLLKLNEELAKKQMVRDDVTSRMKLEQLKIDEIEGGFNKAVAEMKKVNDRFDSQVKLAINKRWGWGDWLRTQPVINGFADPLKIHQFTINDIPIDYNFKQVTRFDRCMSCHVGIDRPAYTQGNLEALTKEDAHKDKLESAKKQYERRMKSLQGLDEARTVPDPNQLQLTPLSPNVLTASRIKEYTAHPRLDLYVGANSKHPTEKFGCTSCHSGQGSGTSFTDASHTPNDHVRRESWIKERGWESNHMWDFPMLSTRFIESSCIKCHHEVTDLISTDNRVEAPKVLQGYQLIKENGCFGCHEISGWKSGQRMGPDLRLESNPPLEEMNPVERNRVENDTDNRPGNLRKVGPALTRVSEKLHQDWIEKWLRSPSSFRPDTKMPHYYGLSNNHESDLPEAQKKFPNTEIVSIAHFLMQTSKSYLQKAKEAQEAGGAQAVAKDQSRIVELLNKGRLDEREKKEFDLVKMKIRLRKEAKLVDLAPGHAGDVKKGRLLFTERGCLACHVHQATEQKQGNAGDKDYAPDLRGEAIFGPDLSQIKGKLLGSNAAKNDQAAARTWLIQWILDPHVHNPRSRMPVTHLSPHEAADVAAWLLAQDMPEYESKTFADTMVDQPTREDLQNLARVYLVRMLSQEDMEKFLKGGLQGDAKTLVLNDLGEDEKALFDGVNDENALKSYLGKKAVSRLGCYGCHDIPGFENAKPIGVGLSDWGKKASDRLAYEDIGNYFKKHYYTVKELTAKDGIKEDKGVKKEPYEEFYQEALLGHNPDRIGYLNQKIRAPRSYDYNRIRSWDDRSRMPQFHLARARVRKDPEKSEEDSRSTHQHTFKEEADARESISTFVLGLTAEQVPAKSINRPGGDRMAEIKGRQILDKYNCNSCHLIRPGVYDFKADSKMIIALEELQQAIQADLKTEYPFLNHHNWVGRNPVNTDRLTAYGARPTLDEEGTAVSVRLSEALRFLGPNRNLNNIPSSVIVNIPLENLGLKAGSIKSLSDFEQEFASTRPYGGAFADLLVSWLTRRDKEKYPVAAGDSAEARASLPPSLIGEGERTQSDWLYQFLLNPQPVRRMAILRMPKFNMSRDEAKSLVDYFEAVARQNNPGVGLPHSHEALPQRDELDSTYWKPKTANYIAQLKQTLAKDEKGEPIKDKDGKNDLTLYQARVVAYTPLWERIQKEGEEAIKKDLQKQEELIKSKTKDREAKEKAREGEKDAKKLAGLKEELDAIQALLKSAGTEKERLETTLKQLDVSLQQKLWEEQEAYPSDAYRLLTSRELCVKCHQVGNIAPSELNKQGPPLALAHQRLRPDWIERWVDKPQRFVPYPSLMPPYFDATKLQYQQLHAGEGSEQIQALRDVLLNYPRIANLPMNRSHNPDMPAEKK